MLVYGDHRELAHPRERLDLLAGELGAVRRMEPGIDRHSKLVGALMSAGQLLQGIADGGWPTAEIEEIIMPLAACVVRSWDSGFSEIGDLPAVPRAELPRQVELRLPEGFAFYCVYPEAYAEAARKLRLLGPPRVIGIRSIGTSLAPVVAAALGAASPVTVRPFGDPFARQVELPPDLVDAKAHYVIVDEGPGLSGSSFGAVADWLERRGVPLERIAFLPSHGGDVGPQASTAHRERWGRAQRVAALFDPGFLRERIGPLEELADGGPWQRRKYLGRLDGERVFVKFAGLGSIGERKLQMARALHASGFSPEPLGLIHGFLVERWHGDACPLPAGEKPVEEIGRYIGARARLFPARQSSGASIDELLTMCRRNISLALGEELARSLERFDAPALSPRVRRVRTDNKLDREEWLRLPSGKLLKADAVDHHQAHDLIGCQDLAWDVAGAIVEFALDGNDVDRLIAATGQSIDPDLLQFCRVAYAAFRLGQATLAGSAVPNRYPSDLRHLLQEGTSSPTPRETLVD